MDRPLATLKVLDFTTLLPGPFATMMLADMGADVLRLEAPGMPDMLRNFPPFDGKVSAAHAFLNRSKRSLALDLKKPGSTDIVKRLVQTYDIVVEQFRPGVLDRLGIGYEALKEANPAVIFCSITGYGQTGPYRLRAGHDNNYLSLAGVMSQSGRKESGPVPFGLQVADVGGGSFGALAGVLAAVIQRMVTGQGQAVDISMFDMSVAWNSLPASTYLVSGRDLEFEDWFLNGGGYYDYYRTADNRYLSVGSLEPKFWEGFCRAIERADLFERGFNQSQENQQALKTEIRSAIQQKTLAEWLEIFAGYDVCVEPVLKVSESMQHPQTVAREMVTEVPKPDGSSQKQIASPFKFSGSQPQYSHIGVEVGQHTDEVLGEIGYSPTEIDQMKAQKLFN